MRVLRRIGFKLSIFIINNFMCGVHFFRIKRFLLRQSGMSIGDNTKIVGPIVLNTNDIIIGNDCWIGRGFTVDGNGQVVIGDRCDFAPEVLISTGSHEIDSQVRRAGVGLTKNTSIGSGTWIGTRSTIIEGSNIGSGSVIGACSLINKNIGDNVLAAGVPAKIIKRLNV